MLYRDASTLARDIWTVVIPGRRRGGSAVDDRRGRRLGHGLALGALFLTMVSGAFSADAARYREEVLHRFPLGHEPPQGRLVFDGSGNLYGIKGAALRRGGGSVFELSPQSGSLGWKYTRIYTFCFLAYCPDGGGPVGGLVIDASGNLYGVTEGGGAYGGGTIFELSYDATAQSWRETVLHSFCAQQLCTDGSSPNSLIMDGSGNLFGTELGSDASLGGGVFELSYDASAQSWHYTVLYSFCGLTPNCRTGADPTGLVQDAAGNLYGTTLTGGTGDGCGYKYHFGCGTVFELSYDASAKEWKETVLYSFCPLHGCTKGFFPNSIVMDGSGNIYGTTEGNAYNTGTAYALTHSASDGTWAETVMHTFCSPRSDCRDGYSPLGLTVASSGSLYGTTSSGGVNRFGTVFSLNYDAAEQRWSFTRIYSFCEKSSCTYADARPSGPLIIDTAGNLYGITAAGSSSGLHGLVYQGTVYRLQP